MLILDEATAGLSAAHERAVLQWVVARLPETVIIGALHRPDNLDLADLRVPLGAARK